MDVLAQYTSIRCEIETNLPVDVVSSLQARGLLRHVLDQASDDVAVLKAKSLIMMEDFMKAKKHCPLVKVSHRSGFIYVSYHTKSSL